MNGTVETARALARRARRGVRRVRAEHLWRTARTRYGAEFPLTDQPALILAPHYDDETLGCGGLIARKRDQGAPVGVLFVTDGRRCFGPNAPDPEGLEAMRRREARAALAHLGVAPEAVRCLGLPDGELSALSPGARERAVGQIGKALDALPPGTEVYAPHRRDRHPDHEAVFALARAALDRRACPLPLIEYAVWYFWDAPSWDAPRSLAGDMQGASWLDIGSVVERKRAAIAAYRSQHAVLPTGFLAAHSRPVELFIRRLERAATSAP